MKQFIENELRSIAKRILPEARQLEGKTLLITGGAGFLGSYFIGTIQTLNKYYFKKSCKVISFDNFITGVKNNLFFDKNDKNLKIVKHNVQEPFQVKGKVDFMIHAAGIASPVYYMKYPLETIDTTIGGLKNVLNLARKLKPRSVLYFSSSEIYGDPDPRYIPTPETYRGHVSCWGPRACYDESKRLGETICEIYHRIYGVPVKITRPFNVYGPGMKEKDYRVIPNFMTSALMNKPLTIHHKGNQTRTFCYATDAMVGFFKVLLSGTSGQVYNIGNDEEEITMLELAKRIQKVFGKKLSVQAIQYPKNYPQDDPSRRCPDLSKAKKHLKYRHATSLNEGLEKTLEWYKKLLS